MVFVAAVMHFPGHVEYRMAGVLALFRLLSCVSMGREQPSLEVLRALLLQRDRLKSNRPMSYREPLPHGCPPDAAKEINEPLLVFRLVKTNPATDDDFKSQQAQYPTRQFDGVSECQARGLSVYTDQEDAERQLKLARFRGYYLCGVRLEAGAGSIQKTGNRSHHTWWPLAEFDILARCNVERS